MDPFAGWAMDGWMDGSDVWSLVGGFTGYGQALEEGERERAQHRQTVYEPAIDGVTATLPNGRSADNVIDRPTTSTSTYVRPTTMMMPSLINRDVDIETH